MEQHQQREQLQTARNHVEDEDTFAEDRKMAEICRRSDHVKTRSHIVDGCRHRRQIRLQAVAVKGNQQHGACEQNQEGDEIHIEFSPNNIHLFDKENGETIYKYEDIERYQHE